MLIEYIASNPNVQMAFLLMLGLVLMAYMVNRRIMKAQEYDREEKKEVRRERFMALPSGKKHQTINEGE